MDILLIRSIRRIKDFWEDLDQLNLIILMKFPGNPFRMKYVTDVPLTPAGQTKKPSAEIPDDQKGAGLYLKAGKGVGF